MSQRFYLHLAKANGAHGVWHSGILKRDWTSRILAVVGIYCAGSIQGNYQMGAVRRDLVRIPLINRVHYSRGLGKIDDGASSVVIDGATIPDVDFVTTGGRDALWI